MDRLSSPNVLQALPYSSFITFIILTQLYAIRVAVPPRIEVGPGFDSQGSVKFFTKYCFHHPEELHLSQSSFWVLLNLCPSPGQGTLGVLKRLQFDFPNLLIWNAVAGCLPHFCKAFYSHWSHLSQNLGCQTPHRRAARVLQPFSKSERVSLGCG